MHVRLLAVGGIYWLNIQVQEVLKHYGLDHLDYQYDLITKNIQRNQKIWSTAFTASSFKQQNAFAFSAYNIEYYHQCNLLLAINNNPAPIWHRFWHRLLNPSLFSTLDRDDPFKISGKPL